MLAPTPLEALGFGHSWPLYFCQPLGVRCGSGNFCEWAAALLGRLSAAMHSFDLPETILRTSCRRPFGTLFVLGPSLLFCQLCSRPL